MYNTIFLGGKKIAKGLSPPCAPLATGHYLTEYLHGSFAIVTPINSFDI